MFGYFGIDRSRIDKETLDYYRSIYCSVCYSIKNRYGRRASFFNLYEIPFLMCFFDFMDNRSLVVRKCIIPFSVKRVSIFSGINDGFFNKMADLSIFAVNVSYVDSIVDFQRFKSRMFRLFFGKVLNKNINYLYKIKNFEHLMSELFDRMSKENIRAFSFPDVTDVCNIVAQIAYNLLENSMAAEIILYMLEIMYLFDAFEDYRSDVRNGRNNFLRGMDDNNIVYFTEMEILARVEKIRTISKGVENLSETRGNIIHNVLDYGLVNRYFSVRNSFVKKGGQ